MPHRRRREIDDLLACEIHTALGNGSSQPFLFCGHQRCAKNWLAAGKAQNRAPKRARDCKLLYARKRHLARLLHVEGATVQASALAEASRQLNHFVDQMSRRPYRALTGVKPLPRDSTGARP